MPHPVGGAMGVTLCHCRAARETRFDINTSVDTGHLGASLSEHYRLPHGSIIVGTH